MKTGSKIYCSRASSFPTRNSWSSSARVSQNLRTLSFSFKLRTTQEQRCSGAGDAKRSRSNVGKCSRPASGSLLLTAQRRARRNSAVSDVRGLFNVLHRPVPQCSFFGLRRPDGRGDVEVRRHGGPDSTEVWRNPPTLGVTNIWWTSATLP